MIADIFKVNNGMGFILKITGCIVIAWGIIQIIFVSGELSYYFGEIPALVIITFFKPIIIGLLIIGFGEMLDLLQRIFNQNEPKEEILTSVEEEPDHSLPKRAIPVYAEQDLREFYQKKGVEIDEIKPTHDRDVFLVKVEGKVECIELGGFSPRLLSQKEAQKYM